uniref:Uncharacterized protein n=1 Tax=Setaria italica TaxID=4555 RepID=K3XNU6_SETIT
MGSLRLQTFWLVQQLCWAAWKFLPWNLKTIVSLFKLRWTFKPGSHTRIQKRKRWFRHVAVTWPKGIENKMWRLDPLRSSLNI